MHMPGTSPLRQIETLLNGTPMRRVRSGLGGSHTVVTYPPLDALTALKSDREPFELTRASNANLYFHIAFCEFVCQFCHYHRSHSGEKSPAPALKPYLSALRREIRMRKECIDAETVDSVYIGGGTPTALPQSDLEDLLESIREIANLERTLFSVETSPLTAAGAIGAAKLAMLKEAGMNRISIGVQSFNGELLRTHRGHELATLYDALDNVMSLGIDVNVDLMQDLPLQTGEAIEEDLAAIARIMPSQVTWYILRLHEGSAMNKIYAPNPTIDDDLSGIAKAQVSAERRLRINQAMAQLGYKRQPGGRFLLRSGESDIFKTVRGGVDPTLLGFGASSYSHGWGYFFRNLTNDKMMRGTNDYIRRMKDGGTPIGSFLELTESERRASAICRAARTFIPDALLDFDDGNAADWRAAVAKCTEAGLFERDEAGYALSWLGELFEEEISSLFYSRRTRELLMGRERYWANSSWFDPTDSPVSLRQAS